MVVLKLPKDEKKEELLDSFMDHLNELKEEASGLRKTGYDTKMVDIMMVDVPSYVKLARATYLQSDIDKVKSQLAQIRHELDLVKTGNDFDEALERIKETYELLRNGKKKDAAAKYRQLTKIYKNLPEDLRKTLYKASFELHSQLQKQ
ncbi:TPA: hypothetical protein HA265_01905 [Candidatus Woesearchaeota archaeon]|nr:hypothetical protein [Candidatus Woesearchaeota archaeon]